MKWNWGTGILTVIVIFLAACLAFIIYSGTQRWDLVEDDYYPKELRHEEKLIKIRNSIALTGTLQLRLGKSDLTLIFPDDFRGKRLSGTINIYRPSQEELDRNFPVKVDTSLVQVISLNNLSHGKYIVKVDYESEGKSYFTERDIFIP